MAKAAGAFGVIAFFLASLAAWVTHFVVMMPRAFTTGPEQLVDLLLMLAGIIAPIGVIHGYVIWFS